MASDFETLLAIERSGNLNPVQRTQLEGLKKQYGTSGGGGMPTIPAFKFDYDQAEKDALAKLEPYYKQKLDEAQGDVERAKRLIEEDYARGNRYREEDLGASLAEEARKRQEEIMGTTEDLNRRGVLYGQIPLGDETSRAPYSDVAQRLFLGPQSERQAARKLAIERAIQRQSNIAGTERARGLEEQNIQFPRYQRSLEEEKRRRAFGEFVPLARERALAKYQESYGQSLAPYLQGGQV